MSNNTSFLKLKNVSKFYYNKGIVASGFSKVNLEFNLGEFVVITGESGSGKSTLLNVLSGLDTYEEGEMYINGEETSHYGESEFEYYRKYYIGNIFQTFNLVSSYTVYQNIELVLLLNGYKKKEIKDKVINLIKQVDLYRYRNTKVSKLSGGQKQRVAIARALAKETPIIIADEPTGNLDSRSAQSVMEVLAKVAKDKLVIIVTHNYEQAEKYATRKIVMSDGKVRDDIILKKVDVIDVKTNEYGNISFVNKLLLGFRNTFNIFSKFILLFIVFLFTISAFLLAYAFFKEAEYSELQLGVNYFFHDTSFKRMVINKKDLSTFTDDDLNKIKNVNYVDKVIENDYILDAEIVFTNDTDYYSWPSIGLASSLSKVSLGRMPEKENEVVILPSSFNELDESILNKKMKLYDNSSNLIRDDILIVGIINNTDFIDEPVIYFNDDYIDILSDRLRILQAVNTYINDKEYYLSPKLVEDIPDGSVYLYDQGGYCSIYDCRNKSIKVTAEDPYYNDSLDVKITKLINKSNAKILTGDAYKEDNSNYIYLSLNDYNKLYNHGLYQISVYLTDELKADEVKSILERDGYNVLAMKDVNYNSFENVLGVIRIVKMIVLIVMYVVLFFISYFVIKIILNSKKVYYATIRILGASRRIIKDLIRIELLTIYHLTYILFMIFVMLNRKRVINIEMIQDATRFLTTIDYLTIYVLLLIMSFIISYRYARKLFKSSAMKAYREEV